MEGNAYEIVSQATMYLIIDAASAYNLIDWKRSIKSYMFPDEVSHQKAMDVFHDAPVAGPFSMAAKYILK